MKKQLKKGLLITIEGIDGSGKSSLATMLFQHLNTTFDCILTQEPGGSTLGSNLRAIVQHEKISPLAEYLLFAADRAEHFARVIIPALQQHKIIISDRMADSSLAYQGYAKKLDLANIELVNNWTMRAIKPDITLYTKVDVSIAKERLIKRNLALTQFEQEKENFMHAVVDGYNKIFNTRKNVIVIDANKSLEEMFHQAKTMIEQWLHNNLS